jgi:hypothetical protein
VIAIGFGQWPQQAELGPDTRRRGMTAAIFALAGTLLGILGTLTVEIVRAKSENRHSHQEALRLACADFTAAVSRMSSMSIELMRKPRETELINALDEAHREARVYYERLRLTAASQEAQKAGRHVLRYAYGLLRQSEGKPLREDEQERGPLLMLHDSLIILYAAVRREIGMPHADEVYREPDDWIQPSGMRPVTGTSSPP